MSQQELSYEIEYSIPHISHVENGMTKASLEFVVKAANALHTTTDRLLCDSLETARGAYEREASEILSDCTHWERKIITGTMRDLKENLRRAGPERGEDG